MAFKYVLFLVAIAYSSNADFVGKFVFHSNDHNDKNTLLSIYHRPDSVNFAPTPGPIPSDEISSVLSLSLGLSIPKDITWNGLLAGSLFQRPQAVLMVSVDNLPKGSFLKKKVAQSFPVTLKDDASTVQDIFSMSSALSLPSHVNEIMNGQSTTLSVSSDEIVAAAGFSRGEKSTTTFWNEMSDSWISIQGDGSKKETLSKHGIYKRIADILPKGFTYDKKEKKVVVNTESVQVSFDMKNQADFNLFSEIVYMKWQNEQLSLHKKSLKDGAPDVFLLSITSLKGLEKKYGQESKQMKAAILFLEAVIPEIAGDFKALYKGNILIVGLNLQSQLSSIEPHQDNVHKVLKSLKDQFGHEFEHVIPELHAKKSLENKVRKDLCQAVQGAIIRFAPSLKFKCHDETTSHHVFRRSLMEASSVGTMDDMNLASDYDGMFPVIFNIWFWLLVLLALATYAISVAMWNMDPGRDSIIYRLTQQKIKNE